MNLKKKTICASLLLVTLLAVFLNIDKVKSAIIFNRNVILRENVILKGGINYALQKYQTKDDWVNSGGKTGEYTSEEATWTEVTGSPFTGYDAINYAGSGGDLDLDSGQVKRDERTGLWWSDCSAVAGTASTTDNVFTLTADGSRPTGSNAIGFCNALNTANFGGYNDWYLPTQKELQQAYIDGSANNLLEPGRNFWSSSEKSLDSNHAWYVGLGNGNTNSNTKSLSYYIRCVRR
ncbi:MAG: Uncharacterized protein Athens101410_690 [Parcubacteria group bacterium Athens1014_10]|nr:MAG: Uncharacterized protein Athens101410_690 [Parcubacteria group bacterium Athens1014_10]TSD04603.1 MAG: Uncharacterized protein Athens071412_740 [Parcubacteria group bacterium Athens0714_12]